jgi:RNA polymerase sigma factor (sigma-70 family)
VAVEKRTDTELVASARSGDKRAFDQLVARYQALAQRVARGMVGDAEIARDLAQEAMLQAYLSLGQLRDDSRFRSWLHGIVRNVCRGYLRDLKADWLSLEALTGGMMLDAVPLLGSTIMGQAGRDSPHDLRKGEALAPSEAPIPELLPILPLRDAVYFPRTLFPIFVGREKSLRALDEAQARDRYVLVLTQKQGSVDYPQPDDIYQVGTVCRLLQLLQLPDRTVRAMIEGVARARVLEYRQTEPFHLARAQVLPEEEDTTAEAEALVERFLERYQ